MRRKTDKQGATMTNEDRRLIVETLGEMRQLKGEMKEFKEHVIGRVQRLEKKETERGREKLSVISIFIAGVSVFVTLIINLFRNWR
jgi:hypothetical protein